MKIDIDLYKRNINKKIYKFRNGKTSCIVETYTYKGKVITQMMYIQSKNWDKQVICFADTLSDGSVLKSFTTSENETTRPSNIEEIIEVSSMLRNLNMESGKV